MSSIFTIATQIQEFYFNMAQNLPQFLHPLLRIGSIAFLVGVVTVIISTTIHPSREDPANHLLVFAEYARDYSWIAVHIGQFAGGIMVFVGGFRALTFYLCARNRGRLMCQRGLALQLQYCQLAPLPFFRLSTELLSRQQWILGLLLLLRKKPSPLELQKGLGLSNMAPIVSFAFFKERLQYYLVAIVKSRWIGGAGVIVGTITIYAGIEVAYLGFGYTNIVGLRGISMIIYFIWVGILGGYMWKKSMSKSIQKA